MATHVSRYSDMPNRSKPTDGLRSGGTGGPAGEELGPTLTGYECAKCHKPVSRDAKGVLRMVAVGRKHFHPGCAE